MSFVTTKSFWETELESPILRRNAGFVTKENANDRVAEARQWLDRLPADFREEVAPVLKERPTETGNPEMDRIFVMDAARTFDDEAIRKVHVEALHIIYQDVKDYHQGLSFQAAFLLLFLSVDDVVVICLYMHRAVMQGYFKLQNEAYLRDCIVMDKILEKRDKPLFDHLSSYCTSGGYISKWWIGMCLHVLPFEAMFQLWAFVLDKRRDALFCFALSVLLRQRQELIATKETAKLLALLRLDRRDFPDDMSLKDRNYESAVQDRTKPGSFYTDLVQYAIELRADFDEDIEELRSEVQKELDERERRRKEMEAQESEEEIVFSDEEVDG